MLMLATLIGCTKKDAPRDKISALNRLQKPLGSLGLMQSPQEIADTEAVNASYYFLLGQSFAAAGKSDQAIVAFERVRKLDDTSAYLHFVLAQEYLKKGLSAEGVAMARKAMELDPKDRDAKLLLANLYATAKKYSEARVLFEQLLAVNADDEEVVLYLSLIEVEEKNTAKAYARLSSYVKRNPESAVARFYLGRILQEQGKTKDAIASFKRAVELRPGFIQAGAYLAALYEESDRLAEAMETYSWLAVQTDGPQFHKKLGEISLRMKNYDQALTAFQNVERLESADLNNRVKVALLLVELKMLPEAIVKFRDILRVSPESDNIRFYLASVLEQSGKIPEAQRELAKISVKSKLYPEALRSRVQSLGKEKKTNEAHKLLQDAFALARESKLNLEDLYEIAISYHDNLNQLPEARAKLAEAEKEFPMNERFEYLKATLLQKEGKEAEAIAVMEGILRKNPKHAGALNFVGYVWTERGQQLARAEDYIRRALKLKPKDPFITDSLGWVLFKRQRYVAALETLREALALRPEESVIADHLGDVLVKMGRIQDARKYYEMALQLGPEKDSERKVLESKLQRLEKTTACSGNAAACGRSLRDARQPATSRAH